MSLNPVFPPTLPRLVKRISTGHKGTYGTVLGIGGSRGMAGAVALAGHAALTAGAGLVRLAVPDPILETVAGFYPELTTIPCPADRKGRFASDAWKMLIDESKLADALFIGPGLGRSFGLNRLLFRIMQNLDKPMVLDADALNALADIDQITDLLHRDRVYPLILTPHSGEFKRLVGSSPPPEEHFEERIEVANRFAKRSGTVLVLKGHPTITTDGGQHTVNTTGNPGMGTGGSGDVLTGVIAALLGQGLVPYDAARLGVFLHGLAGDFAAQKLGEESVIASAILQHLPNAFRCLR